MNLKSSKKDTITKNKKKFWISFWALLFMTISGVMIYAIIINNAKQQEIKSNIINESKNICMNIGLENVKINILNKNQMNDWYNINIVSPDFSDLSYEKMLELDEKLEDVKNASVKSYISNSNTYTIYFNTIYKNNKNIYNGYHNSNAHNSTQESQSGSSSDNYSSSQVTDDEKGFAWAAAEQEVKARLKSPSTAKFPTYNSATITKNGNKYKISGYVDAENSFGAKVRVTFTVNIEKTGSNKYIVINVDMNE